MLSELPKTVGAAGDSVFTNQTSESETETETESEIVEEAGARAKLASAAAAEPSGQGGDAGTGEDVQRPAAWKQLGIKMRSAPRIDEKENFSNLQATSKWFPNAYKAPGNENQSAEDEVRRKKAAQRVMAGHARSRSARGTIIT